MKILENNCCKSITKIEGKGRDTGAVSYKLDDCIIGKVTALLEYHNLRSICILARLLGCFLEFSHYINGSKIC